MYKIINVEKWEKAIEIVSGSKDKEWRICPDTQKYGLLKLPVTVQNENWDGSGEYTGESWSEKIAAEIGRYIGIETHEVEIAYHEGIYCSLCWRFLDPTHAKFEEGADLITPYDATYNREILRGDKVHYNFELLCEVFANLNMVQHLIDMLVFDALVGNTDRHQDNFGIITTYETSEIVFAPLYDNASCLGRELTERRVKEKLQDSQSFEAYINKSSSLVRIGANKRRTKHFELMEYIATTQYAPFLMKAIERLNQLTDEVIEHLVESVPDVVMSKLKKAFVKKVLVTRRARLLEMR